MKSELKNHTGDYVILSLILIFGLFGFWFYSYNPLLRQIIILSTVLFYWGWGIMHHFLEKTLNFKVVVEYTVVALFGVVLLLMIIGASS